MIVKHNSNDRQDTLEERHVKDYEEHENICDAIESHGGVKLDIDIPALNAMFTNYLANEEKEHLKMIKITFDKSWKEISHGEKIMNEYIKFCQTRKEFSSDFFHICNRQYRYLFLSRENTFLLILM